MKKPMNRAARKRAANRETYSVGCDAPKRGVEVPQTSKRKHRRKRGG